MKEFDIYIKSADKHLRVPYRTDYLLNVIADLTGDIELADSIENWGLTTKGDDFYESEGFKVSLIVTDPKEKKFGYFFMGGAIVVADINDEDPLTRDYRNYAHILDGGEIYWVKRNLGRLTEAEKTQIEEYAKTQPSPAQIEYRINYGKY